MGQTPRGAACPVPPVVDHRARISIQDDGQPAPSSDLPSHRATGARPHLPVNARVLCRMAHPGSLAGPVVLRSGTRGNHPHPRSCGSGRTLVVPHAKRKDAGWLEDGSETPCFRTLAKSLEIILRNACRIPRAQPGAFPAPEAFGMDATPTKSQTKALELLETIRGPRLRHTRHRAPQSTGWRCEPEGWPGNP